MKLGWVIPTINTFGSVREMIEISNVLVSRGHSVTIFHPEGNSPTWLPCAARFEKLGVLETTPLDVLIGIVDWQPELHDLIVTHPAEIKATCLMGFNPDDAHLAKIMRGEEKPRDKADRILRHSVKNDYVIMGDGGWQNDWLRENVGIEPGPAFGGINLKMFFTNKCDDKTPSHFRLIYSGDGRERKGTDTVEEALRILKERDEYFIEARAYYGKYIDQDRLVEFLCEGHIFIDGHRRAGWCNPVIEAMACGNAIVCTDIGAVQDFAINEETALVVPVNKPELMANAVTRLMADGELRRNLVSNGLEQVKLFDYKIVGANFEKYFMDRLQNG